MALERKGGRKLSLAIRSIILKNHEAGLSTVKIAEILKTTYDFKTTRQSVRRFLIRYEASGCLRDQRLVYFVTFCNVYVHARVLLFCSDRHTDK